jgi:transcriptional regulator NrdR family protein
MTRNYLIKRKGHREKYEEKKVYKSVYAACHVCEMPEKDCGAIARSVTKEITSMVRKRKIKSSNDIFRTAIKLLKEQHKDAAFMYETHRDVS